MYANSDGGNGAEYEGEDEALEDDEVDQHEEEEGVKSEGEESGEDLMDDMEK
jgi:hypothetical protein